MTAVNQTLSWKGRNRQLDQLLLKQLKLCVAVTVLHTSHHGSLLGTTYLVVTLLISLFANPI